MFGKKNETNKNMPKIHSAGSKKKGGKKITASGIAIGLIALILTVVCFIGLTVFQNYLSGEIVYKNVVVAKTDIPKHTIITKENAEEYLTFAAIPEMNIPETALTSADAIVNNMSSVTISERGILTTDDFEVAATYIDNMTDPVEVTLDVSGISSAGVGKFRQGDLVDISVMADSAALGLTNTTSTIGIDYSEISLGSDIGGNTTSNVSENNQALANKSDVTYTSYNIYVMENVYITRAYTSDGVLVASNDTETNATTFVFTIEREDVQDFYNATTNFSHVRLTKILDRDNVKTVADVTVNKLEEVKEQQAKEAEVTQQETNEIEEIESSTEESSLESEAANDASTEVSTETTENTTDADNANAAESASN
jgi:hypothetical protein